MRKQRIRLSEATLHKIIRRCVNEAVNEISDKTKLSAAYKSENNMDWKGDFPSFRKEKQYHNFADAAEDITYGKNNAYMNKVCNAVSEEYPDLVGSGYDTSDDYFACRDLAQDISDNYQIPLRTAYAVIDRVMNNNF